MTALCSRVQGEGAAILKKLELDANYISEGKLREESGTPLSVNLPIIGSLTLPRSYQ